MEKIIPNKQLKAGLIACFFCLCTSALFAQKNNEIALTPPMGWNSWNCFHCDINEEKVMAMADLISSNGMKEAGYTYVVIDDCWQIDRDNQGVIVVDSAKFPSGIKALADYIHSKGLKFGIYSDAGRLTCQERPGSKNYEAIDAETYANWGVDFLKYDWCHHGFQNAEKSYAKMGAELEKQDRPIVYSICNWGWSKPWEWAPEIGHMWRTTQDIADCFHCRKKLIQLGWTNILDKQVGLEKYAGPGQWNDPDMLQVGNGGLNLEECKAHFSMWCMLAAPLIAGNDLREMSPEILAILTNPKAISIDQDELGSQGVKELDLGDFEIWTKTLSNERMAIALLNRGKNEIEFDLNDQNFTRCLKDGLSNMNDVWTDESWALENGALPKLLVPSHGVRLLIID